uniref:Uncharacterized protein n=1 Tax=Anguilla anguilla TaxID=7936 RepID=A0A0E9X117_ANGAN
MKSCPLTDKNRCIYKPEFGKACRKGCLKMIHFNGSTFNPTIPHRSSSFRRCSDRRPTECLHSRWFCWEMGVDAPVPCRVVY